MAPKRDKSKAPTLDERMKMYGPVIAQAELEITEDELVRITLDKGLPRRNKLIAEMDEKEAVICILDNVAGDLAEHVRGEFMDHRRRKG